jgi:hypothetical protein
VQTLHPPPRPLESLAEGPARVGIGHRRSASPRLRKRMKDSRSLTRYSQLSTDHPCMAQDLEHQHMPEGRTAALAAV